MSNLSMPDTEHRSRRIQEEDDHALVLAEDHGFVIRRTILHKAHLVYSRTCRERGVPCVCVYLRRGVADVTVDMPGERAGWQLSANAQDATKRLIRETTCAAYNVGPTRVACCRIPAALATGLARQLHEIAMSCRPSND